MKGQYWLRCGTIHWGIHWPQGCWLKRSCVQ